MWKLIAKLVSRPTVANWLIKRAQRTPYFHLEGYMNRWWLFNHYQAEGPEELRHERRWRWLPSVRIHHILREDIADDMHDHPWNARTIILKGWYDEERAPSTYDLGNGMCITCTGGIYTREAGDTASLNYGEFHNIKKVSPGGVWTMFFTWNYKGSWGFLVDGVKIPWRKYEEQHKRTG